MITAHDQLDQLRLAYPAWTLMVWAALALGVLGLMAHRRRAARAERFTDETMRDATLGRRRRAVPMIRTGVLTLSAVLLSIAAARPQANPHTTETETRGRDIVFLVDVSRSMLARDVAPNRLGRSKLWIKDLVSNLRGDRVALVAFAGNSSVQCPLTADKLFFDLALDGLSPSSVPIGGTNIGDSIRRIMTLLYPESEGEDLASHRDIVLITDGEDQDSLPVEAARLAGAQGVRIIAIGIGSDTGAPVLDENENPVERSGNAVQTKLDAEQLAQIAQATPGGVYLDVGTGDIDLAQVYEDIIASAGDTALGSASLTTWDELYMYAAAPALVLLVLEALLGSPGTRRRITA